jgi:hypothetical protein
VSYTSDELGAIVDELVQGTLAFPRDRLGPRNVGSSLSETRELVNSALLYESDSVFYLIFIASQSLQKLVNDEIGLIDDLLDSVDDLLKPDKPVEDVSGVADATTALTSMENALGRSGRLGSAEISRYTSAVARATRSLGASTKMNFVPRGSSQSTTDLVRPQAEAKKASRSNFDSLKSKHSTLLTRVDNLLTAYESFDLQQLSEMVARQQVSRAREQMSDLNDELSSLTSEERTEIARLAVIKLLANKSVINSLANTPVPGDFKVRQPYGGSATYRVGAYGVGTPPSIVGSISAPWPLEFSDSQNITFELNDQPVDLTVDLLPTGDSYARGVQPATLIGMKLEPFRIYPDLATPRSIYSREIPIAGNFGLTVTTDRLHMIVDGTPYELTLPVPCTVAQAVAAVAGDVPGLGDVVTASSVAGTAPFTLRLRLQYTPATKPEKYSERHMLVIEGAENAVLGPYILGGITSPLGNTPGNAAHSVGWDANDELKVKANDDPIAVTINLPTGVWNGDPSTSYQVTAVNVKTNIDAQAAGAFTADVTDGNIVLISSEKGEGSILTIQSDGVYGPGLPSGDPKPGSNTPSLNGATDLGFFDGMEDRQRDVDGRVVVNLLNKDLTFSSEAKASMEKDEILRERGATRVPTGTSDVRLLVPLDNDPTGTWPPVAELKLQVLNGENSGTYGISLVTWAASVLTITVDRRLRGTDPALLHQVVVYRDVLKISSLDGTTTGVLRAKDSPTFPARSTLGLSASQVESTVGKVLVEHNDPRLGWKPLDLRQRFIKIEDSLTREDIDSLVTSISSTSEANIGVLGVDPEVQASFGLTTTEGFNIRSSAYKDYSLYRVLLEQWTATLNPYDDANLSAIDKLLSPILLISPSPQRVNAAYSKIEGLKNKLIGSSTALLEILRTYSVNKIQQIEDALQTLAEQGHDRARVALIEANISSYLNMTQEDSSFSRAFIKATSDVVVKDVNEPTNLHSGLSSSRERLVSTRFDDKNPLHDFSDMEDDLPDAVALDFWKGLE